MPASSAPQRSQYHSVGRLSVPHSPHLSVLATPGAPALPDDGAAGASTAREPCAGAEPPGLLGRRAATGLASSSATDLRKASSSPPGAAGSGSRGGRGGLGTTRCAAGGSTGSGAGGGGGGGGGDRSM